MNDQDHICNDQESISHHQTKSAHILYETHFTLVLAEIEHRHLHVQLNYLNHLLKKNATGF